MSETLELLVDLRSAGAIITPAGDKLRCDAPQGSLTDKLREQLRTHKAELLTLLEGKSYWTALAGTKADPDEAWEEEDIIFLGACHALREADSEEHLLTRWNGLRHWLSQQLSEAAILALGELVISLRGRYANPN